ncbi:MAG: DMT family transporter [Desulfitobacterium hafniense]|nr:DMT family transporter [Desulfitobacterium hafniense]
MIFDWFFLIIIYIFTNSASKLIQKYILKDPEIDSTAFSAFFMFLTGVLSIPMLFWDNVILSYSINNWLLVLLSGFIYTACMTLYYKALQNIEISQVETIATTRSIWLMLLGIILFNEKISYSNFIGTILIFSGLLVIYWNRSSLRSFNKPHLYTLLYAILISSANAIDKYFLQFFSLTLYQVVSYIIPAVLTVIIIPNTFDKFKYFLKPGKPICVILLSCLFQMTATLSLYGSFKFGGELSVVGPLAQTSTVLTIILGIILFKEKWNIKRKIWGVSLTILGVLFIRLIHF